MNYIFLITLLFSGLAHASRCIENESTYQSQYAYFPIVYSDLDSPSLELLQESIESLKSFEEEVSTECGNLKQAIYQNLLSLYFIKKIHSQTNNLKLHQSLSLMPLESEISFSSTQEVEAFIEERFKYPHTINSDISFHFSTYSTEVNQDQEDLETVVSNNVTSWKQLSRNGDHKKIDRDEYNLKKEYDIIHSFYKRYAQNSLAKLINLFLKFERFNSIESKFFTDSGELLNNSNITLSHKFCSPLQQRGNFISDLSVYECDQIIKISLKRYKDELQTSSHSLNEVQLELNKVTAQYVTLVKSLNQRKIPGKVINKKIRALDKYSSKLLFQFAPDQEKEEVMIAQQDFQTFIGGISPIFKLLLSDPSIGTTLPQGLFEPQFIKAHTLVYTNMLKTSTQVLDEWKASNPQNFMIPTNTINTAIKLEQVSSASHSLSQQLSIIINSEFKRFDSIYKDASSMVFNMEIPLLHMENSLFEVYKLFHTDRESLYKTLINNPQYIEHIDRILEKAFHVKAAKERLQKQIRNTGIALSVVSILATGGSYAVGGRILFEGGKRLGFKMLERTLSKAALRLSVAASITSIPASVLMLSTIPSQYKRLKLQQGIFDKARIFQSFGYFEQEDLFTIHQELNHISKEFKQDVIFSFFDLFLISEVKDLFKVISRLTNITDSGIDSLKLYKNLSFEIKSQISSLTKNKKFLSHLKNSGVPDPKWFLTDKILDLIRMKERMSLSENQFKSILEKISLTPELIKNKEFQKTLSSSFISNFSNYSKTINELSSQVNKQKNQISLKSAKMAALLGDKWKGYEFSYIDKMIKQKTEYLDKLLDGHPSQELFIDFVSEVLVNTQHYDYKQLLSVLEDQTKSRKLRDFLNDFTRKSLFPDGRLKAGCPENFSALLLNI